MNIFIPVLKNPELPNLAVIDFCINLYGPQLKITYTHRHTCARTRTHHTHTHTHTHHTHTHAQLRLPVMPEDLELHKERDSSSFIWHANYGQNFSKNISYVSGFRATY